jgi:hypothetical protein
LPLLLSILQPLHGLTFALLHLACMRIMGTLVPTSFSATAQTFYAFGSGLVTAALTLLSGTLYARYGGVTFFPMAVLCGVAGYSGVKKRPHSRASVLLATALPRSRSQIGARRAGAWRPHGCI